MRTRILSLAALVVTTAVSIAAQTSTPNLTGTWKGTFITTDESGRDEDRMHMVAKQTGADLTGTAGPSPEKQWPIAKGKVVTTKDGTAVTFDVQSDGPVVHFELKLVEGRLKGGAKAEQDGRKLSAEVDLEREK
jgi:hypothetical protein